MKKSTLEILIENAKKRGKVCRGLDAARHFSSPTISTGAMVVGFLRDLSAVSYGQRINASEIEQIQAAFLSAANLEISKNDAGHDAVRPIQ